MTKAIKKDSKIFEEIIEKGRKSGSISYEEVITLTTKSKLSETVTNKLLKQLEKENIKLVMESELGSTGPIADSSSKKAKKVSKKSKKATKVTTKKSADPTPIADGVKCYLRDIGKIPLLNKETERVIAEKISLSKKNSILAVSQFPFIHREIIQIGERLTTESIALKDIIQFSDFDEENLPRYEKEKNNLLSIIKKVEKLVDNEEKIYKSYRDELDDQKKKDLMLDEVQKNKEKIGETIRSIKFSNKLIRKLGKRVEKNIKKIEEKLHQVDDLTAKFKELKKSKKGRLKKAEKEELEELDRTINVANKTIKKIENEIGVPQETAFEYFKLFDQSQTADKRAKDDLARANLRLVVNQAKKICQSRLTLFGPYPRGQYWSYEGS